MQLSRYIKKLLPEHEIVIFPGLGAFITTYKPAFIDEKSEEIAPPSKTISFEPKIKHNDGLLTGVIAENENISTAEALEKIEQEGEEILYRLDKGEEVALGNLGILFVNENREITFKPSGEEILLFDAFGLEKTALKEETASIPEDQNPVFQPTETEKSGKKEEIEQDESENAGQHQESASEFITYGNDHPEKRRRGWLWLLLILIPVTIAGVYFLIKHQKKSPVPLKITVETPERAEPRTEAGEKVKSGTQGEGKADAEQLPDAAPVEIEADSVSITDTDASVETAETAIDSSVPGYIDTDSTKFYLISGSFEEAKNAKKYFRRMKEDGYNPYHLGKKGNFYLVGIEIHDNEIEAYGAQYNFLDKHPDSGVWVYIPE